MRFYIDYLERAGALANVVNSLSQLAEVCGYYNISHRNDNVKKSMSKITITNHQLYI